MAQEILEEFRKLWSSPYASNYEDFIEEYTERYQIIKHQKETARRERTPSLEKYRLQPNSMQVGFIKNLRDILSRGEGSGTFDLCHGNRKNVCFSVCNAGTWVS